MVAKKILVLIIPTIMLLILGSWQVSRLHFKNQVIANMAQPPIPFPQHDIEQRSYRKTAVSGLLEGQKFYVFSGNQGYYVLEPLLLADGKHILVNRGTVKNNQDHSKKSLVEPSMMTISGVLYCNPSKKVGWFIKNDPEHNAWFWFDIATMAQYANLQLQPCILWGDESAVSAAGEMSPNCPLKIFNPHLEYAITWYSLAGIWLIISALFLFRKAPK